MVVAIVQARMGSTRLPSKVLKTIKSKTLLELYVNRVKPSKLIDKIVIATTTNLLDDAICKLADKIGVDCFRGSEGDLLDRYYQCALKYNASVIVRITPDDPFVDYEVVDKAIGLFKENDVDFVTNHFEPTYPEGLDVEVYSMQALERSWKEAKLLSEREHVFPYIQNHQDDFKIINFKQDEDFSHLRWTIDHQCDFDMAKTVYSYLYEKKNIFIQDDIIKLIEEHPEIAEINSHIKRKEGVNKTKAEDKYIG
jgi:spore coat polysaccharide biosynthesis protein SpsF (cytidylyltransferase family)